MIIVIVAKKENGKNIYGTSGLFTDEHFSTTPSNLIKEPVEEIVVQSNPEIIAVVEDITDDLQELFWLDEMPLDAFNALCDKLQRLIESKNMTDEFNLVKDEVFFTDENTGVRLKELLGTAYLGHIQTGKKFNIIALFKGKENDGETKLNNIAFDCFKDLAYDLGKFIIKIGKDREFGIAESDMSIWYKLDKDHGGDKYHNIEEIGYDSVLVHIDTGKTFNLKNFLKNKKTAWGLKLQEITMSGRPKLKHRDDDEGL